ncbi:MAG TPA: glycogen debranching N-terminal domain-containing protein [Steroidobacteraceae bacterium]
MSAHPSKRLLVRLRPSPQTLFVSEGRSVLATRTDGLLDAGAEQGLFVHETRVLSRYQYRINGRAPQAVALSNIEQHSWLGYYIAPAPGIAAAAASLVQPAQAAQHAIELRVSRFVGDGMHEDLDVTNFTQREVALRFTLDIDADFADQEETRGRRHQHGRRSRHWRSGAEFWELEWRYRASHRFSHQDHRGVASIERGLIVRISSASSPPRRTRTGIAFDVQLPPQGSWHACLDWHPLIDGQWLTPRHRCGEFVSEGMNAGTTRATFLTNATQFTTPQSTTLAPQVVAALEQAKRDLAALRLSDLDHGRDAWTVAAGLPLYTALFGRDTLAAAWETAPVGPELMRGTLAELARWQGQESDPWRDEEPGRMLHEAHTGPLAQLNFDPKSRYYGSLTPSGFYPFVVAQLWNWTADREAVAPLIDPALRALQSLDERDTDRDGFIEYETRSAQGLKNQGWKDSGDAIVYEDGSQVPTPVAPCEEQGIAYAAKLNFAEVLWCFDRKEEAKRLYHAAGELKQRFNAAFWMADAGFLAMGLDAQKRPIRSIASNALHCLATGILDEEYVRTLTARLFAPDLFSGWGIRTLSADHPAYNPYAYHRGTVWPVEHGPFAVGLYRYGCHDRLHQVCRAQFELASRFDFHRLPECVSGHPRDERHPFPAIYPAANSPQAWSASTVFTLLQAMLGMQAFAPWHVLLIDPCLPDWLPEITLHQMRVGEAVVSIRFFRDAEGRSHYRILEQRGRLHVIRQPSPWSLTASFGERLEDALMSLLPAH